MRVECSCGKALKVADDMVGKKIRCPACKEIVPIPQAEEEEPKKAVKPAAVKSSPPAKSKPSKPAQVREDEEEDADEVPKKSKKAGAGKTTRAKGLSPAVVWGTIAATVVLLGGGVGLAFYLTRDQEKPAQPPSNPMAMRPPQNGMPPGGMPPGMQMPPGGFQHGMPPGGQFPPGGQRPPGFEMPPGGQFPGGNGPPGGPSREQPISLSLDQLVKEYDADKDGTLKKYKGKTLMVGGSFDHFLDRSPGDPVVFYQLPEKKGGPDVFCCTIPLQSQPRVAGLTSGQQVVFRGKFEPSNTKWQLSDAVFVTAGPDPLIVISSEQLTKEFAENAEAAAKKYKGKVLMVEGVVHQASLPSKTSDGKICLESFDEKASKPLRVNCYYAGAIQKYRAVKKGDKIKFKGECDGLKESLDAERTPEIRVGADYRVN